MNSNFKFLKLPFFAFSIVFIAFLIFFNIKLIINSYNLKEIEELSFDINNNKLSAIKNNSNLTDVLKKSESFFNTHSSTNYFLKKASLSYSLANQSISKNLREDYLCKTLSSLGEGLKLEPYNGKILSTYAITRRILENKKCPYSKTESDYKEVIKFALKYDSTNLRVIRDAARIYLLDSNFKEASFYYKQFLKITTLRNKLVDRGVEFLLTKNIEIKDLIPSKIEQVLYWSRFLKTNRPEYFIKNNSSLANLQVESIIKLRQLNIDPKLILHYLRSISFIIANDKVRQVLDKELVYYIEDKDKVNYLTLRSKLKKLEVVCGQKPGDSRPENSNLINWNSLDRVYLDNDLHSIGCYLKTRPRIIEIRALKNSTKLKSKDLEIYISNDNSKWSKLALTSSFENTIINKTNLFSLELMLNQKVKYIKVRYKDRMNQATFYNKLNKILNFYY